MLRQGDVLLVSCRVPTDVRLASGGQSVVLAMGEATGHAHVLTGESAVEVSTADAVDHWLRLRAPAVLAHPEHGAITVPAGDYQVVHQREFDPISVRRVAD